MNMAAVCPICPRACKLDPGQTGFCNARSNHDGKVICDNYGQITSIALDPIEKKPLARFMPGSRILSIGSYGCNFRCGFCQNNRISMSDGTYIPATKMSPEDILERAEEVKVNGNIGLAYTYNEPMIGYEFVKDCAELIHENNMKNVVVSNGYINEKPLRDIVHLIDAANIDLKAFSQKFYTRIGGDIERVKESIKIYAENCHLELTCLIIPGENGSDEEMSAMCKWIANIDKNIPLHISRFFPAHKYSRKIETSRSKVDRLYEIALKYLCYVYKGNY